MKIQELFEARNPSRKQAVKWLDNAIKIYAIRKVADNRDDSFAEELSQTYPYTLDAEVSFEFDNTHFTLFEKPIPVVFNNVNLCKVADIRTITSLHQLPIKKCKMLDISGTSISSFEGCPTGIIKLYAKYLDKVTSLKGIETADLKDINLFSSKNIPEIDNVFPELTSLMWAVNGLTNLKDINQKCPKLVLLQINLAPKLKSHLLGLAAIKSLKTIIGFQDEEPKTDAEKALKIIETEKKKGLSPFHIQDILQDSDLDDYADL